MSLRITDRNEALLERIEALPTALAPKAIQDAARLAEAARLTFNSAEAVALLAPGKILVAEKAWDAVAEQSVRAGGELPPKTLIEYATVAKRIADADFEQVGKLLTEATLKIGSTLDADDSRTQWQTAIDTKAEKVRAQLVPRIAELRAMWNELSMLTGASTYLEHFGEQLAPAPGLRGDPFTTLEAATNPTTTSTEN